MPLNTRPAAGKLFKPPLRPCLLQSTGNLPVPLFCNRLSAVSLMPYLCLRGRPPSSVKPSVAELRLDKRPGPFCGECGELVSGRIIAFAPCVGPIRWRKKTLQGFICLSFVPSRSHHWSTKRSCIQWCGVLNRWILCQNQPQPFAAGCFANTMKSASL